MHAYRSHTCAELNSSNVGDTVRLSGWVHRVRDHGGVLFIDLRDHYGMTQVLCDPDSPVFSQVENVRSEWCIRIDGEVKARDESLINPKLPTGEIEVFIRDIEVLGQSSELPLMVFGDQEYPEETRLRYRYLDLRREAMQNNMTLRSDVVASIRRRMWDKGFREYQTPIITASSPEGTRDFLVPSRLHPGKFYALRPFLEVRKARLRQKKQVIQLYHCSVGQRMPELRRSQYFFQVWWFRHYRKDQTN